MGSGRNHALWLLLAVKAALLGVLFVGVPLVTGIRPDAHPVDADIMTGRVVAYPFVVLVVPAAWLAWRRFRSPASYPYAVDVLWTLPFLLDAASALAGAHDAIWWWDKLGHLGGWALLVSAFMLLLRRTSVTGWAAAGLGVGFGAVTAILWELAEYLVFLRHTTEPMVTYTDTLADQALGLAGSVLAAGLFAFVLRGEQRTVRDRPQRERRPGDGVPRRAAPARAAAVREPDDRRRR